ncbi:hypothetical protein GUJ93_ZPchr0006g45329 [Zizania palustris]|uniref:Uncharacterized protein n=1 Tax=Zizania palustris TaxID=103762 RepID=A0A8J5S678_ZIZPA|nr:hypothetical protein GUJ93_ZPchr0006g45329 [Zizania palustris]
MAGGVVVDGVCRWFCRRSVTASAGSDPARSSSAAAAPPSLTRASAEGLEGFAAIRVPARNAQPPLGVPTQEGVKMTVALPPSSKAF